MKKIDVAAITKAVQDLVTKGEVTFLGMDTLVYHSKRGAFIVGQPEDDIQTVWNRIAAYKNRDAI